MLLLLGKRWKGCRFKHRKSTASSNPAAVLVPTRLCYECTFGALIFEIIVEGSGKYHYYAPQSRRSVKGPIYGTVLVQLCAVATTLCWMLWHCLLLVHSEFRPARTEHDFKYSRFWLLWKSNWPGLFAMMQANQLFFTVWRWWFSLNQLRYLKCAAFLNISHT